MPTDNLLSASLLYQNFEDALFLPPSQCYQCYNCIKIVLCVDVLDMFRFSRCTRSWPSAYQEHFDRYASETIRVPHSTYASHSHFEL